MSNPTNLTELADSLTASLRWAHQRQDAAPSAGDGAYQAGYAAALADTRATVLAMIAEARCPECGCVVSDHHEACSQRPEVNPNVVILSDGALNEVDS